MLDDCGNCNLTDADNCGQVAFLAEFDLKDATFSDTMVFASQYWEIDISTIGEDEPAPVCTPNDQDICTFSNILAFDISTPLAPTKLGETALPRALTDLQYWPNDKSLYLLDTAGVMVAFVDENTPYLTTLSDETGGVQSFRSPAATDDDIAISLYIDDARFFVLHNRSVLPLSQDALDETGLVPLTRLHEFEKEGDSEAPENNDSESNDPGGDLPALTLEFSDYPAELAPNTRAMT